MQYSFLDPSTRFPLPRSFDFAGYIDAERELWALFPETDGKRVNFCQMGLTASIFVESPDAGELAADETLFLMPCADHTMRPIRMRSHRRLTLDEYRMTHLTAIRIFQQLEGAAVVMEKVDLEVLGPEILNEEAQS